MIPARLTPGAGVLFYPAPARKTFAGAAFATPVMKYHLRSAGLWMAVWSLSAAAFGQLPAGVTATPLKAASQGEGTKLFTTLGPDTTGLTAVNKVEVDHPQSFMYHSGVTTGGVIVADFDGDGKPDIFFAGSTSSAHDNFFEPYF